MYIHVVHMVGTHGSRKLSKGSSLSSSLYKIEFQRCEGQREKFNSSTSRDKKSKQKLSLCLPEVC